MRVSSPPVRRVSFKTAERCLDRLGPNKVDSETASNWDDAVISDTVSINELKEIAFKRHLKLKSVRIGWDMLRVRLSADPILLILRNKNAVLAVRSDPNSTSQIVVFDPLYPTDDDFFLPRNVLETMWDGDAIIVHRLSSYSRLLRSLGASTAVCIGLVGLGLVIAHPGDVAKEHYLMTAMQDSERLPSDASSITGPSSAIGANTALPDDGEPPFDVGRAVGAAPFINIARASASDIVSSAERVVPNPEPTAGKQAPAGLSPEAAVPDRETVVRDQDPLSPNPEPVIPARETISEAAKPEITAGPENAAETRTDLVSVGNHPEHPAGRSTPANTPALASPPALGAPTQPIATDSAPIAERFLPESQASRVAPEGEGRSAPTAPSARAATAVEPDAQKSIAPAEMAALVAHGDSLFGKGDVTSARLFYERAAEAGHGLAALRLGESYDPSFLGVNGIPVQGDPILAARWYERARQLGVSSAAVLLNALRR